MRAIGLPGQAFVPLMMGLGCGVPAIMSVSAMDRASDRILTILMVPFMSCRARLPVYVLIATAFFPASGQNVIFALYVTGIAFAVLTGVLIKRIVLTSAPAPVAMELPAYRLPSLKAVTLRAWAELKDFLRSSGKVIVCIMAVLTMLNSIGTDGSFGNGNSDKSVISAVGKAIVPAFAPMGIKEENWPAAVSVFTGLMAKEAIIGSLSSLYDGIGRAGAAGKEAGEEQKKPWSFGETLGTALERTGGRIAALAGELRDPLGLSVGDLSDTEAAAAGQDVTAGSIGVMRRLFGSRLAAFSYMLLILLYMPCGAAMAAAYRQAGFVWTAFLACWTTALGFSAATIAYRIGTFAEDPLYAAAAIGGCLAALSAALWLMRSYVRSNAGKGRGKRRIRIRAVQGAPR
ncbi:MAG: hypothetical protein HUK26_07705 [Duodenibacillus sp.]|nr:hypothetical protein [Duodenibacillus sp.]